MMLPLYGIIQLCLLNFIYGTCVKMQGCVKIMSQLYYRTFKRVQCSLVTHFIKEY